jgi:predicted ATPase
MIGFGVSGFRSFGPDPQYIAPLEKINLFAGRNNSGKSNILRIVALLANRALKVDAALDFHHGKREAIPRWHLPVFLGGGTRGTRLGHSWA